MSPLLNIYIEKQGIIIILFKCIRLGVVIENERLSFDFCIYKLGITFSLIKSEENLCLEIE